MSPSYLHEGQVLFHGVCCVAQPRMNKPNTGCMEAFCIFMFPVAQVGYVLINKRRDRYSDGSCTMSIFPMCNDVTSTSLIMFTLLFDLFYFYFAYIYFAFVFILLVF